MSYSTVMVHLDLAASGDARLDIACDLAQRFNAALIGVAAGDPRPGPYFSSSFLDSLIVQERQKIEARLAELKAAFEAAAKSRVAHAEWRAAIAATPDHVALNARAADIVIVGARRAPLLADATCELDPADIVMKLGRPLLVVPPEARKLSAERIVVAWKDTREARRAIHDALPLLVRCGKAIVAAVHEDDETGPLRRSARDVVAWLERHGVPAESMVTPAVDGAAEQIEAIARQFDADLIVAGAYGHSRLAEWVLGGVTREFLMKRQGCTLLSH